MATLDLDPNDYALVSQGALGREAALARVIGDVSSGLSGGYNMAGSDDGGERFAASYDSAAAGVFSALSDSQESVRNLARALAAVGALHASAERSARGLTGAGNGFEDPGAGVRMCVAGPPTCSGGNPMPIPGLEMVIDFLGGLVWPDADTDRLREASDAWLQLETDLRAEARELRALKDGLSRITSDETTAFGAHVDHLADRLEQIADAVGNGDSGIAGLCADYATQVDDARNQSEQMLKDLALELAVGVGVSVALSFVTFGAAAAAGAAATIARCTFVGGRIAALLNKLRLVALNIVTKLADVLTAVSMFRSSGTLGSRVTFAALESGVTSVATARIRDDGTSLWLAGVSGAAGGGVGGLLSSTKFLGKAGSAFFGDAAGETVAYSVQTTGSGEEWRLSDAFLNAAIAGTVGGMSTGFPGRARAGRDAVSGRNQAELGTASGADLIPGGGAAAPTSGRPTAEAATATSGSATRTDVDAPVRGGGDVAAAQGAGTASKVPEGEAPVSGGGEVAGASAEGGGVKVPDGEAPVAADVDVPSGGAVADAPSVDAGAVPEASVGAADAPSTGAANSAVEASPSHVDTGVEVDARADAPVRSVADAADGDGPVRRLPGGRGRDDVDSADAGMDVHRSGVETAESNVETPTSPDVETSSSRADGDGDAEGSADAQARAATDGADADGSQSKADGDSGTVADSDVSPQSSDVDGMTGDADAASADGAGTSQDASAQAGVAPGRESWEGIDRFPDNYSTEMRVLDPSAVPTTGAHYGPPVTQADVLHASGPDAGASTTAQPSDLPLTIERLVDSRDEATFLGRDSSGGAHDLQDFAHKYALPQDNGEMWYNFPDNNGAVPGTTRTATVSQFESIFGGRELSRSGADTGRMAAPVDHGRFYSWDQVGLPPKNLYEPFHRYEFTPGADDILAKKKITMVVEQVAPALGRPGGGMQVRWLDVEGNALTIFDLGELKVLREVFDAV